MTGIQRLSEVKKVGAFKEEVVKGENGLGLGAAR